MVLDFQDLVPIEAMDAETEPVPSPQISVIKSDDKYGEFAMEPLDPGFGMTLGNPLRRVLYSSLSGTAITWVKIEGVLHEYATMPHVKEEVSEFLLNTKGIRLRSMVDRPGKMRLEVAGEGEVCAGDIIASSDFEVVNPELHLLTLDSPQAKVSVEFNVENGTGYMIANQSAGLPIGVLPVDAIFTPIKKVNYTVSKTRVGQRADLERLAIELWTDGSITPLEALRKSSSILVNQFFLFADLQKAVNGDADEQTVSLNIPAEHYNIPVERLELSSRTLNCLKRAGLDKVGEVLELNKGALLGIRNFGEKSFSELFSRLRETELLPPALDPDIIKDELKEDVSEEPKAVDAEHDAGQEAI